MPTNRPAIPASIERALRQEAGFGCCKCGVPIIEYHHIIPFSQSPVHEVENMMCLCPLHHAEADRASTETEQRQWKEAPANIRKGFITGTLKTNESVVVVDAGTVQFIGSGCIVRIDRRELFRLEVDETGRVLLSVQLLDKQGKPLVEISNNDWRSGDSSLWDIEADFKKLTVRQKQGEVALSIDTTKGYIQFTGVLWHNGALVRITPSGIRWGSLKADGNLHQGGRLSNIGLVQMTIAIDTTQRMTAIVPIGPNGNGVVVSRETKEERIHHGIEAYHRLMADPPANGLEHLFPENL